jgi:acylphosphatase
MCRRFRISGRVQGVFFRASTRDFAQPLGISGHAINLADGSVEVLACGEDGAVERLREWLRHGPPSATVTDVEEFDCGCTQPNGFATG